MRKIQQKPIDSMNPVFLHGENRYEQIIDLHKTTFAEVKEDGYRLQIHKTDETIKAFTRAKNEIQLGLFPEIVPELQKLPNCILDCELRGPAVGHAGFQNVQRRFRHGNPDLEAYLKSGIVQNHPISLTVFDTLSWEGNLLLKKPLQERRTITESICQKDVTPSMMEKISCPQKLEQLFESLVDNHYEGLVCKNPASKYQPGKKTPDWIKLKREEPFDVAVIGVYLEKEEISQLLCGVRHNGVYQTIAKVNAKRNGMHKDLHELLQGYTSRQPKGILLRPDISKEQIPTYFVQPTLVVEIAAMNVQHTNNWHSCGYDGDKSYSLRIAWLKRIRQDKSIDQISTTADIEKRYKMGSTC